MDYWIRAKLLHKYLPFLPFNRGFISKANQRTIDRSGDRLCHISFLICSLMGIISPLPRCFCQSITTFNTCQFPPRHDSSFSFLHSPSTGSLLCPFLFFLSLRITLPVAHVSEQLCDFGPCRADFTSPLILPLSYFICLYYFP